MLRFANSTERKATVSTWHLSSCSNVNNKVVTFCDEMLESDVTKKDLNMVANYGKILINHQVKKIQKQIILFLLNKM